MFIRYFQLSFKYFVKSFSISRDCQKYQRSRGYFHELPLCIDGLNICKIQPQAYLPERIVPTSKHHHSRHTISIPGTASFINDPQSIRQCSLQPGINIQKLYKTCLRTHLLILGHRRDAASSQYLMQ